MVQGIHRIRHDSLGTSNTQGTVEDIQYAFGTS